MEQDNTERQARGSLLGPGKTFAGKLWRGIVRGSVDGIPWVGPIVTAVAEAKKGEVIKPVARVLSSSVTILAMIGLAAERIWGDAEWADIMFLLSRLLFGA